MEKSKMFFRIFGIFIILSFVSCIGCVNCAMRDNYPNIKEIGYAKFGHTRYKTFNIVSESIPKEEILRHASSQMYTQGYITACFYFNNGTAPNVSFLMSGDDVLEEVYSNDPFFAVWKMPNGQVNCFNKNQLDEF